MAHDPGPSPAWLLLAASAWGSLRVGASFCGRALRLARAQRPPAPFAAAAAGAALAWTVAGDLSAVRGSADTVALALLAAALALTALAPRGVAAVSACRAGLFDCAMQLPRWHGWRKPAQWPQHAATLVMLPMMVALPRMAEWCAAEAGVGDGVSATVALHLAAMVLPAWAPGGGRHGRTSAGPYSTVAARLRRGAVALAMLAGGLSLLAKPGVSGLMTASLWQALAWSLAWGESMDAQPPGRALAASLAPRRHRLAGHACGAVGIAAAVLALGCASEAIGPPARAAVHAALALLAAAGAAWLLLSEAPPFCSPCPTDPKRPGPPRAGQPFRAPSRVVRS